MFSKRWTMALCVGLMACAGDPYLRAQRSDSADDYRRFLVEHPDHEKAPVAHERLAELALQAARNVHTVLAYKRFLEEFGSTPQAAEAQTLLAGLRFIAAQDLGTARALRQFLRENPGSAYEEQARKLLADAEFRELAGVDEPQRLAEVAQAYPEDARTLEAQERLDSESFRRAHIGGPGALLDYLERFPAGAHRDEARLELLRVEVEGLVGSALFGSARELLSRSPLGEKLPALALEVRGAESLWDWAHRTSEARRALVEFHVRPADELVRALRAPDARDRWEAAEELGEHVSVRTLGPLWDELSRSRNVRVRLVAFDSVQRILAALPPKSAELELARRMKALEQRAGDAEVYLQRGVLEELARHPDAAVAAYAQAHDALSPDPFLLWRMSELRRAQGRWFSAAVASRQLVLWADRLLTEQAAPGAEKAPGAPARQVCAAQGMVRYAMATLQEAQPHAQDMAEDVASFARLAQQTLQRVDSRLRDFELAFQVEAPGGRTCAEVDVASRRAAGAEGRMRALVWLVQRGGRQGRALVRWVSERDPSKEVRTFAAGLREPSWGPGSP